MFNLHPRLAADTMLVVELPLSTVLLMNDSQYPWLILVPRREDIREIYQLSEADQVQLLRESSTVAQAMMKLYRGDKMNIGALGNMVPQLHLHHIVRYEGDPTWPGPVWGAQPAQPYADEAAAVRLAELRQVLQAGEVTL